MYIHKKQLKEPSKLNLPMHMYCPFMEGWQTMRMALPVSVYTIVIGEI